MKQAMVILITFYSIKTLGQDGRYNFGARNSGIAGSSVTLGDRYSLFNNIGGLGRLENHSVFAGYQNRFGIQEFQVLGAGAIYHAEIGNAGIGFYRFGDDLFSQQRVNLAIGNQFQMVSLGLGVDLIQYNISGIGTKQVIALQFGGIAEITPHLFFGAHIFNLNQVDLVKETGEKIPTVMKAGLSFRPTEELMINTEIEKDLDFREIIKGGIEYRIVRNIVLRTGVSTRPFLSSFGIGIQFKRFILDYSYSHHSILGAIHESSLAYTFQE